MKKEAREIETAKDEVILCRCGLGGETFFLTWKSEIDDSRLCDCYVNGQEVGCYDAACYSPDNYLSDWPDHGEDPVHTEVPNLSWWDGESWQSIVFSDEMPENEIIDSDDPLSKKALAAWRAADFPEFIGGNSEWADEESGVTLTQTQFAHPGICYVEFE